MSTGPAQQHQTATSDRISITQEGMSILKDRLRVIDEVRLPQMRALLVDRDRDERDVAAYERLLSERHELSATVDLADVIPSITTRGPLRLSLGMRARIRLADGSRAWVRPVHPAEAHLDDERISMHSPLAQAILGAQRGAVVEVAAPCGPWACTVLSIERPRAHAVDAAA